GPFASANGGGLYHTQMFYDGGNRLRREIDAEGNTSSSTYDQVGNLKTSTDGRGSFYTVTYEYDAKNRLVRKTTPTGSADHPGPDAVEEFNYDAAGNLIEHIDPRGEQFATHMDVDARGLVLETKRIGGTAGSPETLIEKSEYDLAGNRIKFTDVRGDNFVTTY